MDDESSLKYNGAQLAALRWTPHIAVGFLLWFLVMGEWLAAGAAVCAALLFVWLKGRLESRVSAARRRLAARDEIDGV